MNLKSILTHYIASWIMGGGLTLVLVSAARNLPKPLPMGSRLYEWFYGTVQSVCSNKDLLK